MWMLLAALVLAGSPAFQSEAAATDRRIPLFLKQTSAEGLTDPSKERQDSLADLLKSLRKSKVVRVVEAETDAVIVLAVLGREQTWERNTTTVLFGGPFARARQRNLTVQLTAGTFTSELSGTGGKYSQAAGKVVKQIEAWVQANRETLTAATR